MTALSTERVSDQLGGQNGPIPGKFADPVKGGVKIFAGSLVALQAGYARPGTAAQGLFCRGKALSTVDNTLGADGALTVESEVGVFRYENSSGVDQITQADVGANAFVVDDQTMARTSGGNTRSIAGMIVMVDTTGVYVLVGTMSHAGLGVARVAGYRKDAADGAAANATSERAVHRAEATARVLAAFFVPDAALVGDPANNATLTLSKRDGAGGAAQVLASVTTTASMTAFVPVSLGTINTSFYDLVAGNILTFAITKSGTGVVVPAGQLVIVYGPA